MDTSTTHHARHAIEVHIPEVTSGGCLLKLVSIIHARAVPVTDVHYRCLPDGSARLSATFLGPHATARTLRETLLRAVHVSDVTMVCTHASPASVVGL